MVLPPARTMSPYKAFLKSRSTFWMLFTVNWEIDGYSNPAFSGVNNIYPARVLSVDNSRVEPSGKVYLSLTYLLFLSSSLSIK